MNKSVLSILLVICLAIASQPLVAQTKDDKPQPVSVPRLLNHANAAYEAGDYEGFRKAVQALHRERPYNSEYMYQLVIANALLGDRTGAYDTMLTMQRQGLAYDFLTPEATKDIRGTQAFDYLAELMVMAGDPMGDTRLEFTLPDSVSMPETIAWDESRGQFLIGTRTAGSILAVDPEGQVTPLIKADKENGLWAVIDILVDADRNRLWVTSAAIVEFAGYDRTDRGRSALYEFDLKTLELKHRYPVPVDGKAHFLGSMVLSPQGDLYIVDRNLPLVYRKSADEDKIQAVMGFRDMISMRGVAMRDDGSIMYIADREMGIAMAEIKTGRTGQLVVPDTLNLGGIDGLYFKDNSLIMVQNGIKPQRVMKLLLDPTGTNVTGVVPMAVAQPEFDYPTFGTLKGEKFYFFANSHWAGEGEPFKPVTVLSSPLNSDKELTAPDLRHFLQKQAAAKQEQEPKPDPDVEKN